MCILSTDGQAALRNKGYKVVFLLPGAGIFRRNQMKQIFADVNIMFIYLLNFDILKFRVLTCPEMVPSYVLIVLEGAEKVSILALGVVPMKLP